LTFGEPWLARKLTVQAHLSLYQLGGQLAAARINVSGVCLLPFKKKTLGHRLYPAAAQAPVTQSKKLMGNNNNNKQ